MAKFKHIALAPDTDNLPQPMTINLGGNVKAGELPLSSFQLAPDHPLYERDYFKAARRFKKSADSTQMNFEKTPAEICPLIVDLITNWKAVIKESPVN